MENTLKKKLNKTKKNFSIKNEDNLQILPLIKHSFNNSGKKTNYYKNNLTMFQIDNKYKTSDLSLNEINSENFPVPSTRQRHLPSIPMIDASFNFEIQNKRSFDVETPYSELDERSIPKLSFVNFDKKYSMSGVNEKRQEITPKNQTLQKKVLSKNCFCVNLLKVEVLVSIIAFFELIFILYQAIVSSIAYNKTGDENAFAFTLTLFSFVLAIINITLLLIGIHKKSSYFLVPHLLMQLAIFLSAVALCIYFILLIIGGTSVLLDTVFYEDSTRGELAYSRLNRNLSVKTKIIAHELNSILFFLLFLTLLFVFAQAWFFIIVKKCYSLYKSLCVDKKKVKVTNKTSIPSTTTDTLNQSKQFQKQKFFNKNSGIFPNNKSNF